MNIILKKLTSFLMISVWFRVIRVRFLLASVIAVSAALSLNWWLNSSIDIFDAVLTFAGVLALHASVDLLNDFWDFKRGIDTTTKRTKLSGGTGVLPEGLLEPSTVYRAGILFLIIGSLIGTYFVFTDGITIAVILGFAILSIYFYSTKIVDSGLGEFFVAVKGSMIVIGTFFIQSGQITMESILAGIVVGTLSSMVLFIASFPDHDADKSKGRKTLVISVGKQKAAKLFWIFPIISYSAILCGVSIGLFPEFSLISFFSIPLMIKSGRGLQKNYDSVDDLVPFMSSTLMFSRLTGILFVAGFLISLAF
jgi:1,4-dihydroxy-2-naphthoate octaprenyltransferase